MERGAGGEAGGGTATGSLMEPPAVRGGRKAPPSGSTGAPSAGPQCAAASDTWVGLSSGHRRAPAADLPPDICLPVGPLPFARVPVGCQVPPQSWLEALPASRPPPGTWYSALSCLQVAIPRTEDRRQRALGLGPQPRLLQGWRRFATPKLCGSVPAHWSGRLWAPGCVRGRGQAAGTVCPAAAFFPALCCPPSTPTSLAHACHASSSAPVKPVPSPMHPHLWGREASQQSRGSEAARFCPAFTLCWV